MGADTVRKGSCLCGNIKIEVRGDPIASALCHCTNCQKASGAAFVHNCPFLEPNVTITDEHKTWKTYEDGNGITSGKTLKRTFCSNCGSPICNFPASAQPLVVVCTGLFDTSQDRAGLDPQAEIFCDSQRDWWGALSSNIGTQKFARGFPAS